MNRSVFAPRTDNTLRADSGPDEALLETVARIGPARVGFGLVIVAAAALLAGCVDGSVGAEAPQAPSDASTNMVAMPGVSPAGTTVAIASFAGGPDALRDRFSQAFAAAAKSQDIITAAPGTADYLVRGYLNAVPDGEGTAITYVLDVFDAKKHRTQRVEDEVLLPARAADPWSLVDDRVIAAVANKSAAGLAAVLTHTPQAMLAAAKTQPSGSDTATAQVDATHGDDGHTVVAATPPPAGPPPQGGQAASLDLH